MWLELRGNFALVEYWTDPLRFLLIGVKAGEGSATKWSSVGVELGALLNGAGGWAGVPRRVGEGGGGGGGGRKRLIGELGGRGLGASAGGGAGAGASGWGGVSKPGGRPGVCTGGFGDLVWWSGIISDTDASEEAKVDNDATGEAKELFGPLRLAKTTDVLGPLKAAVVVTDWKVGVGGKLEVPIGSSICIAWLGGLPGIVGKGVLDKRGEKFLTWGTGDIPSWAATVLEKVLVTSWRSS
jgi:hypothetical protein